MALKTYITAMPAMIMTVGDEFLNLATAMMMKVGMSENTKALATMVREPAPTLTPSVIASVAPNPAPDETPVVYGSASGFLRTLCITTPATASPAPVISPAQTRGSLYSMMV